MRTEKRGRKTIISKRVGGGGGKMGQGLGALKRGAGTPLRTMVINIFKTKLLLNYYNVAQLSN